MKELISKFVKSRTCMIWLMLFIVSTIIFLICLFMDKASFAEWAAFNGSTTIVSLFANKAEQKILGQ